MERFLKVILWGQEIGRLAWDPRRNLSYFTYNPDYLRNGLDVFPLVASIKKVRVGMPIWGENKKIYQQLPSFLADALPDAWGNQLFDLWRRQNHIPEQEISPIEKLSFIGKRSMGALEFEPETSTLSKNEKIDLKSLANLAERIFTDRDNTRILPKESITLQSLLTVGTSAGGRQPKAIIAMNKEKSEIRSGQIAGYDGFEYYLLKFGNSEFCSAELEMTYYDLAIQAGIRMMESELYEIEDNRHFLTKRFDRKGNSKLHTQTLAAMDPDADSYEQLLTVCRRLHLPECDCEEVYRRMVFNILANNTDDHNKNFSFIMDEKGEWRLSPAYDITFIFNNKGYQPEKDHCLFIRARLSGFSKDDVIQFAKDNGIRRPESIIRDVVTALLNFKQTALKYKVSNELIGRVESCISSHLENWGEIRKTEFSKFMYKDKEVTNVWLEQALKGNLHLYAIIDGHEKKYIIRKGTDLYQEIITEGISSISMEKKKDLVCQFLII